jgi:hypothetical protein
MASKVVRVIVETAADLKALRATNKVLKDTAVQAKSTRKRAAEVGKSLDKAGSEGKSGARGILELSRGFEDLQFGIRGVLNNIPGTIQAFGGTAKAAGLVSFAAVGIDLAFRTLGPMFKEVFASGKDSAEDFFTFLDEEAAAGKRAVNKMVEAQDDLTDAIDRTVIAKKEEIGLEGELAAAVSARVLTEIENDPDLNAIDKARATSAEARKTLLGTNQTAFGALAVERQGVIDTIGGEGIKGSQAEAVAGFRRKETQALKESDELIEQISNAENEILAAEREIEKLRKSGVTDSSLFAIPQRRQKAAQDFLKTEAGEDGGISLVEQRAKAAIGWAKLRKEAEDKLIESIAKRDSIDKRATNAIATQREQIAKFDIEAEAKLEKAKLKQAKVEADLLKAKRAAGKAEVDEQRRFSGEIDDFLEDRAENLEERGSITNRQSEALLGASGSIIGDLDDGAAKSAVSSARAAFLDPGNDEADRQTLISVLQEVVASNAVKQQIEADVFRTMSDTVRKTLRAQEDMQAAITELHRTYR